MAGKLRLGFYLNIFERVNLGVEIAVQLSGRLGLAPALASARQHLYNADEGIDHALFGGQTYEQRLCV